MRLCTECGMELDDDWLVCPKCDTPVGHTVPERRRRQATSPGWNDDESDVVTVDVGHSGLTAADIPGALDDARSRALMAGASMLRIVHGYGSAGRGGILRDAVHKEVRRWQAGSEISGWKDGAKLSWPPPARFAHAHRGDVANAGITLVVW